MTTPSSQKLGLWSTLFLGINSIIGTGLFLLPGKVLSLAGEQLPFIYSITIVIVLAIAWCCAYCATLFKRNGGPYVYAKEAFGPFVGAQIGLMRWFVSILAWASLAAGAVTGLSAFWPAALQQPYHSILIVCIIGSLTVINLLGVSAVKGLNGVIATAKLAPVALLLLLGIFWIDFGSIKNSTVTIEETFEPGQAALVIFYAFSGFESLCVIAGEMRRPTRDLPLAIFSVLGLCAAIYFAIQLITMSVLSESLIASVTPLSDAAISRLGAIGGVMMSLAMFVSISGVNLASSFTSPRSASALAEDGLLPPIMAENSSRGAPHFAILLTGALTLAVALSGSFTELVAISAISRFASNSSTCIAAMRFQQITFGWKGLLLRPWRLFIPLIALIGIAWLVEQVSWHQLLLGMGGLIIGLPLYFCRHFWLDDREKALTQ